MVLPINNSRKAVMVVERLTAERDAYRAALEQIVATKGSPEARQIAQTAIWEGHRGAEADGAA